MVYKSSAHDSACVSLGTDDEADEVDDEADEVDDDDDEDELDGEVNEVGLDSDLGTEGNEPDRDDADLYSLIESDGLGPLSDENLN